MTTRTKFRYISSIVYSCDAPDIVFSENWDEVPQEHKDLISDCGLRCDGGGVPGHWCDEGFSGCPYFGGKEVEEDEQEEVEL